jgi:Zn-dependent metalloprotease
MSDGQAVGISLPPHPKSPRQARLMLCFFLALHPICLQEVLMSISLKKSVSSFFMAFIVFFVNIYAAVPQNGNAKKIGSAAITATEIESVARELQNNFFSTISQPAQNIRSKSAITQSGTSYLQNKSQNDSNWSLVLNKSTGTPRFIAFNGNEKALQKRAVSENLINNSLNLIKSNQDLFKIKDPINEFKLRSQLTDPAGNIHIRFSQYVKNIEVWGKEINFHYNSDGSLYSINAAYVPTPEIQSAEKIDSITAITIAKNLLQNGSHSKGISEQYRSLLHYQGPEASKCIWNDPTTNKAHLTWQVKLRPNIQENWILFIDISNGDVLWKFNQTPNQGPVSAYATDANGLRQVIQVYNNDVAYYMIDASRPIWIPNQTNIIDAPEGAVWTVNYDPLRADGVLYSNIISNDNSWKDSIAVSAHNNA